MEKTQNHTRKSAAALAVLLALAFVLLAVPQAALASTGGDKIATSAASISYSRTVYKANGTGTEAYMKACAKLGSYYTKNLKQMQCNVPVTAAVKLAGVDKKFPNTCADMYKYMNSSSNWENLGNYTGDTSMLQPGDVLIRVKGTTTYKDKKTGKTTKAATSHACVYVGKSIVSSVYKSTLKGTDADVGSPGSTRIFVSAHTSVNNSAKRTAACLQTASAAYADYRMIVFRFVGDSDSVATTQTSSSSTTAATASAKGKKLAKAAAGISYSKLTYQPKGTGTKAYVKAIKSKLGSYYTKSKRQMKSNVSVATAVRTSGVDKKFPLSISKMYTYMNKSKNWENLGNFNGDISTLQAGDVLIRVKDTTTYTDTNGDTQTASSSYVCMYIGKEVASSVYKNKLKGTDADKGSPGKNRVFVSANNSSNTSKSSAACMKTISQAHADYKLVVFRYVG